jgi:hypothetical protein
MNGASSEMTVTPTQPFTETQADAVEWIAKLLHGCPSFCCDVPQSCTVEVHLYACLPCEFRYLDYFFLRENGPIKGVFQCDNVSWRTDGRSVCVFSVIDRVLLHVNVGTLDYESLDIR